MKTAIITSYTFVSPWKEKWEEQMRTWIPKAKELGIPVYTMIANSNVEGDYLEVGDFIHFKGKMRFDQILQNEGKIKYDNTLSMNMYATLCWARDKDLDYILIVDNDVFVEPSRLANLFTEYSQNLEINYAGHCNPYMGWNPQQYPKLFIEIQPDNPRPPFASGGCGIVLSKKAVAAASTTFLDQVELEAEDGKWCNDLILAKTLNKHNIPLFQDGRFYIDFPKPGKFRHMNYHPSTIIPYIGNPNSPLVSQHEADGYMDEIVEDLNW
jgi:hypothetical protein